MPSRLGREIIPHLIDEFWVTGPNGKHRCIVTAPAQLSLFHAKEASMLWSFSAQGCAVVYFSAHTWGGIPPQWRYCTRWYVIPKMFWCTGSTRMRTMRSVIWHYSLTLRAAMEGPNLHRSLCPYCLRELDRSKVLQHSHHHKDLPYPHGVPFLSIYLCCPFFCSLANPLREVWMRQSVLFLPNTLFPSNWTNLFSIPFFQPCTAP